MKLEQFKERVSLESDVIENRLRDLQEVDGVPIEIKVASRRIICYLYEVGVLKE